MIRLYKKQILILMVLFFASHGLNAQIRGEIKDSQTKEAAMFTNVMLLNPTDSSLVAGATANEKGKFVIRKVEDGNYILKVSFIGYKRLLKNIEVKGKTDLGTLYLEPSPETLSEVEIVAERPLYSMDGDKTVYSVEDDPSIQTGTTTDALQNAPGVQVDAEGNITLQGV
ncbi:MAG: carboxypeptidase-like regulatory domain-containing protein, partial [Bacteroidales bacterium]|nr:carboxypeptidase-like regulatory domain-containing protein [Bacteroidales bacterium]